MMKLAGVKVGLISCFGTIPMRRFICTLLLAIGSLLTVYLLPSEAMQWIVRHLGYYFILGILVGGAYYAIQAWREREDTSKLVGKDLLRGSLTVFVAAWIIFVHATFDYKIAMDDYLLASTAKGLHEAREVSMVTLGSYWGDTFTRQEIEVDKRPWFYPFCVSVLHDIWGYSDRNPFVFNAITCVIFLGLVYVFGHLLAGRPAGVLSVLLWASLPLLSQNATGAGMEMLNLCLLQLLCVLSVLYLRKPSAALESVVSLTAVLLVYTRYESGLFIFPAVIVIMLGWWRSRKIFLSWGVVLSSVALVAVALQTRMYSLNEAAWELDGGAVAPFAWSHIIANMPHALNFFLSYDMSLANSPLLGVLAVPAVLAFAFLLRTELKVYWHRNAAGLISMIFGLFILLQFFVTISFHAGQLDQRFVSRYSLPFHIAIVSATVAVLAYAAVRWRVLWRISSSIVVIFILVYTLPSNSRAIFNHSNFVVREFNWLTGIANDELAPRSLYVDRYTVFWSLEGMSAVPIHRMSHKVSKLMTYLDQGVFSEAYVIRRAKYASGEFGSVDSEFDDLQNILSLELVAEKSFKPLNITQVYRVCGLNSGGGSYFASESMSLD